MPIKNDPRFIGRAWISPDGPVTAGALGTWTISYEVGAYGYDERARLKIASRFASDWGRPQFTDPKGANYTTVRLETRSGTSVAELAFEPRGQVRPWFKCLVVSIADGSLSPGDRIHVTIGDRSGGGPGSRAPDVPRARLRVAAVRGPVRHRALHRARRLAGDRRGGRRRPPPRGDRADHRRAGGAVRRAHQGRGRVGQPLRALHRRGRARRHRPRRPARPGGLAQRRPRGDPPGRPAPLRGGRGGAHRRPPRRPARGARGVEPDPRAGARRGAHVLRRPPRPDSRDGRHRHHRGVLRVRPRRRAARHDVPPGQRLPGDRGRVAAPPVRDRPVPRRRPLRDLRRLRVVGDDARRRRPQRDVPGRRRLPAPVVPCRGRGHVRRGHRLLPRHRAVRAAPWARRRDADSPHRRPLRRHRGLPRPRAGARHRDLLGLGALRVAARGRAPPRLQGGLRRQLGRPQGAPGREPPRRVDVRRVRRPHLRRRRVAHARSRCSTPSAAGAATAPPPRSGSTWS